MDLPSEQYMVISQDATISHSNSKVPLLAVASVSSVQSFAASNSTERNALDSGEIEISVPSKIYDYETLDYKRNKKVVPPP